MNREDRRKNARKEFDSKKDFTVKIAVGVEECERIDNGKIEHSFWAEIHTKEGQMDVESNVFHETRVLAEKAAEDFNLKFPFAYIESVQKAKDLLDEYKMAFCQRKPKPHLSVVK